MGTQEVNVTSNHTLAYAGSDRRQAAYVLAVRQNAAAKRLYERRRRGGAAANTPREKPAARAGV